MKRHRRTVAAILFLWGVSIAASMPAFVDFGIDALKKERFKALTGARVALITNHTGVDKSGRSTVESFAKAKNLTLVCVLAPEHGFKGQLEHGKEVSDEKDELSGVPVYSLYGKNTRPTDEMLNGVDTIVFDIQDVGTRFYTYATTMGLAIEEAGKRKIRFVVLDRPNPIRGDKIHGDVLDRDVKRMTGYFEIPIRHGLTMGELATWFNVTHELNAELVVIPMRDWKRSDWFDHTGHVFIPPSPNIRTLTQALLYSGIGCFEASNMSVGRGTETPFELFGAPWINGKALCAHLRGLNFPGITFEPVEFTPQSDIYTGERCEGVRMTVTNRNEILPFDVFTAAFLWLSDAYPAAFKPDWEEVRVVTGSHRLWDAVRSHQPFAELREAYRQAAERFAADIKPFFLY